MSNYEEAQKRVSKLIEQQRSIALEYYCETTGADMGKVIYTQEGWTKFCEWIAAQVEDAPEPR